MTLFTRITPRTIASVFQAQDSRTTEADQFYNVRDIQMARQNYNACLAKVVQQPIFTLTPHTSTSGTYLSMRGMANLGTYSGTAGGVISRGLQFGVPVHVPPYCQTCTLRIYGEVPADEGAGSARIFGAVDVGVPPINSDYFTTVSSTATALLTATVPVSPRVHTGSNQGLGIFSFFVESPLFTSALKTGTVISDVGPNWLECATSVAVGTAMVITNSGGTPRSDILPKQVLRRVVTSGGAYRHYIDTTWEALPLVGNDLVDEYNITTLRVRSMSLHPDEVTDFGGQVLL